MNLQTRWVKIIKDMWANRSRSLLVILSIAVGVAAVGMINSAAYMIKRDLYGQHAAGNPAVLDIYVSPFDENLAHAVEGMREVETAGARRTAGALVYKDDGDWEDITLNVLPDYADIQVNQIIFESGDAVPGSRGILLERSSAKGLGVDVGDSVTIETDDDRRYALTVTGIIQDNYVIPYNLMHEAGGYVSMETLSWMGFQSYYNRLEIITAENKTDKDHVLAVGDLIRDRVIERSGYQVGSIQIPGVGADPGEHWAGKQINGLLLVLTIMGILAIVLSGGLVVNTVSAILNQQLRQIGIMRSVGAVRGQIISMYLLNVLVFSILGLLLAYPIGLLGGYGLAKFAASMVNFNLTSAVLPLNVFLLQTALGLIMPVGVALVPILSGSKLSVYDAIYQDGRGAEKSSSLLENAAGWLNSFNPTFMLSMRNTFRKKGRLVFTLITLTLAGAMFISVFSTRSSLNAQIKSISRYLEYDVSLNIPGGANKATVEREAMRIADIEYAEGWASSRGVIIHDDGSEGEEMEVIGIPADSKTVDPLLLEGRWLQPGDTRQVVVNDDLLVEEPNIKVGSQIMLKVGDKERSYEVVGIASKHIFMTRIYMVDEELGRLTGLPNTVNVVRVRGSLDSVSKGSVQKDLAAQLEERFTNAQLSSEKSTTREQFFSMFTDVFNLILIVLVIMATILAVVGGLGLTGTIGMNVLERTREIGVLRAVGASNRSVRQVVLMEGVAVALIAWVLGAFISGPSGLALANAVIQAVLSAEASYQYSVLGLFVWLAVVILIGVVSSLAPAENAVQLTVREVLDYE